MYSISVSDSVNKKIYLIGGRSNPCHCLDNILVLDTNTSDVKDTGDRMEAVLFQDLEDSVWSCVLCVFAKMLSCPGTLQTLTMILLSLST